jgi:predicted aminopeptidase
VTAAQDGAVLTASCLLLLSACSPVYVLRAGYEEAKILWRREPIARVLQRGDLDPETRAKLELTLTVRAFARDTLHLRVGHSYATFARVDPDQVVHVVSAAYRFRLQPYTWWFPILGRVPYKGFFSAAAAAGEAAGLEHNGYDTYVRPSVAFSTLGWFDDPLLSSLLRYDRAVLADVIIHELLHNTSYLAGHADFDESFATFVGGRGAVLFFRTHPDAAALGHATDAWDDALTFSAFLGTFTARLRDAYGAGVTLPERQHLFRAAQDEFQRLPLRTARYRDFATRPLNNAVILHDLMYADRLQLFEDLFVQASGDLAHTIAVVLHAVEQRPQDPFAAVAAQRQPAAAQRCRRPPGALGLNRAKPPDAVARGQQQHGHRERQCRSQGGHNGRLYGGGQWHAAQAAHEHCVDRPGLQHDDHSDEGHAENHVH